MARNVQAVVMRLNEWINFWGHSPINLQMNPKKRGAGVWRFVHR